MTSRRFWQSPWLWLVVSLVVLGALKVITSRPTNNPPPLDAGSSRSDGALALRLWLERLGHRVSVTNGAPGLADAGTILMIRQGADPGQGGAERLLGWVRNGGRLVVATDGSTGGSILSALHLRLRYGLPEAVNVIQPLLLAPPAVRLTARTGAVLVPNSKGLAVASTGSGPVLWRQAAGHGTVWILTAPSMLANDTIARAENRRLALNLAGGSNRAVIFDQESPPPPPAGESGSWLTDSVWGILLLFLLTVALLWRWLGGWRLGPPVRPANEQYRAAGEYVRAVARLLRRGHGRAYVVRSYQRILQRALSKHAGDAGTVPAATGIERLLAGPEPRTERDLVRWVEEVVAAEEAARSG